MSDPSSSNAAAVVVTFHDGALEPAVPWLWDGAGAAVTFEGIVRPQENDAAIAGLLYEVYQPMAMKQMRQLAMQAMTEHALLAVQVEHSEGEVPAGGCSFRLRMAAAHRGPALAAMAQFIDRMKRDVPIWKKVIPSAYDTAASERAS